DGTRNAEEPVVWIPDALAPADRFRCRSGAWFALDPPQQPDRLVSPRARPGRPSVFYPGSAGQAGGCTHETPAPERVLAWLAGLFRDLAARCAVDGAHAIHSTRLLSRSLSAHHRVVLGLRSCAAGPGH